MNKKHIKFEKISFEQFMKDCDIIMCKGLMPMMSDDEIKEIYDNIKLPERKTSKSAGYDFHLPFTLENVTTGYSVQIPTGIKCDMEDDIVLELLPRSSYGFKYEMHLVNTVGVIDADYYNNENNEGHIMAKVVFSGDFNGPVTLERGQGFIQGIFKEYFISEDDTNDVVRVGGTGSTD